MINATLAALADELADAGIPSPLTQPITLAALWDDLARLAGEEPPPAVVAALAAPVTTTPAPAPRRWHRSA